MMELKGGMKAGEEEEDDGETEWMEGAEESVSTLICLLCNLCFQSESIHSA